MIKYRQFVENLMIASEAARRLSNDDAAIVECGTWQGGMAGALIGMCGVEKRYIFLDSFEGLPPVREIDGQRAVAWQADNQVDNCRSSIATFHDTVARSGIRAEHVRVVKGFFEDTLPALDPPAIQILRLDADWYDSTMDCLRAFWDYVVPGGVVIIDDYYAWDGCARAVHDFLSDRQAIERLRQGRLGGVAFIAKE